MADGGIVGKQRLPWLEDLVEVRAWGKNEAVGWTAAEGCEGEARGEGKLPCCWHQGAEGDSHCLAF